MRYTAEVVVNLPRADVLELLGDRTNDMLWRPELALCEPISGASGCLGAETRLIYDHRVWGAREVMEHVVECSLPDLFALALVSTNVVEHQVHRFAPQGAHSTLWSVECEIELKRRKLRFLRTPTSPRDDARSALESFKAFAEGAEARAKLDAQRVTPAPDPRIHMSDRAHA